MAKQREFYLRNEFLWGTLFLTPPLGIIVLWIIHHEIKSESKKMLTMLASIWYVIIVSAAIMVTNHNSINHFNQESQFFSSTTELDSEAELSLDSVIANQLTTLLNSVLAEKTDNYQPGYVTSYQVVMEGLYVCNYDCLDTYDNEEQLIRDSLDIYLNLAKEAYQIEGVEGIAMNVAIPSSSDSISPKTARAFEVRTSKQVFSQFDWETENQDNQIAFIIDKADHIWHNSDLFSSASLN